MGGGGGRETKSLAQEDRRRDAGIDPSALVGGKEPQPSGKKNIDEKE